MSQRPDTITRAKAIQLAQLLSKKEKDEEAIDTLFNDLSTKEQPVGAPDPLPEPPDDHIGIYVPVQRGGVTYYVRDKAFIEEFPHWADVEEIAPKKKDVKRIVLIGESVARGYFFDPTYSCSRLLEGFLNEPGNTTFEIVDLAHAGMTFDELESVYIGSFKLEPDAILIFAGNNWLPQDLLTENDLEEIVSVVKSGNDFPTMKASIERSLKEKVEGFLQIVDERSAEKRVPVVMIIPEFNLKDWRAANCFDRAILWPGPDMDIVQDAIERGEDSLQNGDLEAIKHWGEKLVALSPTHPTGYELLANYYERRSDFLTARKFLQLAKDTGMFRIGTMPRTFTVVRDTLLMKFRDQPSKVIDLPKELEAHAINGIPDRELFMDYCHMTLHGLVIAMKVTAARMFDIFGIEFHPSDASLTLDSTTIAKAYFCAALHNAHCGPQTHVLEHHCARAVEHDPAALDWMAWHIDLVTSKLPWHINSSYLKLLKAQIIRNFELLQIYRILDLDLVDAMSKVIERYRPGTAKIYRERQQRAHGLKSNNRTNLLDSYYHSNSYKQFATPALYFQSFSPRSKFSFFFEGERDILIDLTLRVSFACSNSKIIVLVNNKSVIECEPTMSWTTRSFEVLRSKLVNGLNELEIRWPNPITDGFEENGDGAFKEFIERYYQPVIGEVHGLFATAIDDRRNESTLAEEINFDKEKVLQVS